ncbi:MAG: uroporphyrinogen-III C-methyltransferase [Rhodanobacteraceae bacterium]|nr:uroporphyrinogen-III C-methyltransferase [Rhodanobacteraceae bacterium]
MDMDTPDTAAPAPAPAMAAPPPAPAPARRSLPAGIALVLAAVAVAIAGIAWWRSAADGSSDAALATDLALARTDIDGLRRAVELDRRERDLLRQRLADGESINKTLREEVLGVSERARVLEDAISNLADSRLTGHDAMLLNEAEMVLLLAQQRFELFRDAAAAARAYRIADSALAALQDPAFATVRETLAVELRSLEQLNQSGEAAVLAEFGVLRSQVARLPLAAALDRQVSAGDSKLWRVFGQFVRITHAGPGGVAVADPALLRNYVGLELRSAELALLERNEPALAAALDRAQAQLKDGFAANDTAVAGVVDGISRLRTMTQQAAPLPTLGATLKELRNLRAAQGVKAVLPRADGTPGA